MRPDLLIPILGDQLSATIASLREVDRATAVVLMVEVMDEVTYVRHHKKKVALVLSAMRHFAGALLKAGWRVDYVKLDAAGNSHGFTGELLRAVARHGPRAIRCVYGSEYRVRRMQDGWAEATGLPVALLEDDRFFCTPLEFYSWAQGRQSWRMEDFYHAMRRRTGLLMTAEGDPVGGRWNYDAENRAPPSAAVRYPAAPDFTPDATTRDVLALVETVCAGHFGTLQPFAHPVTRTQALKLLDHFITHALPDFGRYQDAMVAGEGLLFHSMLSSSLNLGLLLPDELCARAAEAYALGKAPLNSVEGFVRQILGWREYMRGMYWWDMPGFAEANALGAVRPLPDFYWTAKTDMRCMAEAVGATRDTAYAHHIQRLMVLGNFAMLAGVRPQDISDWFLVVYADAYDWVELPNVIGMSQFADSGRTGTKPYAAGGAYIDRMSDYCRGCRYDVKAKTGADACPFNALYWDFLARNDRALRGNHRLRNMYANWDRMAPERQAAYRASAAAFLAGLVPAEPGWARPCHSSASTSATGRG